MNFSKGGGWEVSQDSTAFAQIVQAIVLWPGLMADSALSALIPINVSSILNLLLPLRFVSFQKDVVPLVGENSHVNVLLCSASVKCVCSNFMT